MVDAPGTFYREFVNLYMFFKIFSLPNLLYLYTDIFDIFSSVLVQKIDNVLNLFGIKSEVNKFLCLRRTTKILPHQNFL